MRHLASLPDRLRNANSDRRPVYHRGASDGIVSHG